MATRREVSKQRKVFSLTASVLLVMSALLIGISLHVPTTSAAVTHNIGNVDLYSVSDFGRIIGAISWGTPTVWTYQTTREPSGVSFIGLVIDQDNYTHTAGSENIADSFSTYPYAVADDFSKVSDITLYTIDGGETQKSAASFQNTGVGTGDPNDLLIDQTVWTRTDEDWAILQWTLNNLKGVPITGVDIGLEVSVSQAGNSYGVGGDSGDEIDGFDAVNDTYWIQDDGGTTLGFASVFVTDPITHYYSEDYHPATWVDYQTLWENETWLYERINAPNSVEGAATQGNRTSTVGWNGITIDAGSSRTFTLVIACNDTQDSMNAAIKDAQFYYQYVATGFLLTEFSDSGGTHQIEVFNKGRQPTPGSTLEFFVNGGPLTGTWDKDPLPTNEHAIFTVTGGVIGDEGDSLTLYESSVLIDGVAFGQEGVAPDPLPGESVARYFDTATASYGNDWVRNASTGPTWGAENNVGTVVLSPPVVLNRVMFNPLDPAEAYVELTWRGFPMNISGYQIVCDDAYTVPQGTNLNASNKFFVLPQRLFPPGFDMDDGTTNGDNVYLYHSNGNLINSVGWSSAHTQGYFMSRIPDGNGTSQGYDDTTSQAAGWFFDNLPYLMITEFYADSTSAQIELYNPRGGDKVFASGWTLESLVDGGGPLAGTWAPDAVKIWSGDYSTFTLSAGTPGDEGDTITLYFDPGSGNILMDETSFGTYGVAPDPLTGESTARYWDSTLNQYSDEWNRDASDTFGSQNDVPALNLSSFIVLTEVMFNPSVDPDGKYVVITNREPGYFVRIENYYLVSDAVYQIPYVIDMFPGDRLIIRYGDDSPASDAFYTTMNDIPAQGDNVYLYDPNGQLCDMVGWNTQHTQGMTVRRIPDGNGTNDGYDDTSSVAAGWVFDNPLDVLLTEISDSESSPSQIEIYNPWYPTIAFDVGFTFVSDSGPITPNWVDSTAGSGEYAYFDVDASTPLDPQGDTISFYQNGILIESIGYGQKGTVPDPLPNESVQRYFEDVISQYSDVWERNWTTGPNFGAQNDVQEYNLTSQIILNEVLFYPNSPGDYFVEVYNKGGSSINISGFKIVGNTEYIIPIGTELDFNGRFFYLLNALDPSFFENISSSGDNIYLYDAYGGLVDMVGWNSSHTMGGTVCRVPNGNGTSDGYDDVSSIAAGWQFNCTPTVSLITVSDSGEGTVKYGTFGTYVFYNLTIVNLQLINDTIDILNFSQEGWTVEILDTSGKTKISNVTVGPGGAVVIVVNVSLPSTFPFAIMDNITILIRSSNSEIIGDNIILNVRVYPFLNITKTASPSEIYLNGTGHDEVTTITLNMTGLGAQVAVRKYLDTVFLIDSSGSMEWNDPTDLRITESQNFVANNFNPDDRGAIVDFDENPDLLPLGPEEHHLSMDYAQIIANFNDIDSEGGTFMSAGLNLSIEEIITEGDPIDHTPNIILLTDAENLGGGDVAECYSEANYAASLGIIIFTIGLNIDTPQELQLLEDIANITGGVFYDAPDPSFFASIYENISSYLADLAVWDENPLDPNPMVRDVLPIYIDYIPGSFSIPPDSITTGPKGETILEWDVPWIKLGETWSVSFDIVSNQVGWQETNVYAHSRALYYTWGNTTEEVLFPHSVINVLPGWPFPPRLHIDMGLTDDDILLYWDEPLSPGTDRYLIYISETPTGFDFSSPWVDTNNTLANGIDEVDGQIAHLRTSWNHTGAADPGNALKYREQWYYCMRSVNALDQISSTSRIVGKWTKEFTQAGVSTFSLPLEPLETMTPTADFYLNDMNANYIKWIDTGPSTQHVWLKHGGGDVNDTTLEVGRGYEVEFGSASKYTFLGMPGTMIKYTDESTVGFDYAIDADSLDATVDPATGNVNLTWDPPASMSSGDQYYVYFSTTRDGFFGTNGIDYQLISIQPEGTETALHAGAAQPGTQLYYMVRPLNATNIEGASTYSIGVWTSDIMEMYDTVGIPLKLSGGDQNADYYCGNIDNAVGINYFIYTEQRWSWHSFRMPSGAYDPTLIMTEGYQISTSAQTKFTFIGR